MEEVMSDVTIVLIGIAVVFLAVIRVGWLAGRKLSEPPRRHDRADDVTDKRLEDWADTVLPHKDTR